MRRRGQIDIWFEDGVLNSWYEADQVYDGTGSPKVFSDFAIITCHEIRQVFKLPLRQCQGFIDSLFQLKRWDLNCPDYSFLSNLSSEFLVHNLVH